MRSRTTRALEVAVVALMIVAAGQIAYVQARPELVHPSPQAPVTPAP